MGNVVGYYTKDGKVRPVTARKGRRRGARPTFKKKSMFTPPRYEKYADIVSFENPEQAEHSAQQLLLDFDMAKTRDKKRRVKRVTVLASSRARASAERRNLSPSEHRELKEIAEIYERTYKRMKLPKKER